MYGIPGYNFQEQELVTGAKLRQWAEEATWRDISASQVSGLVGIAYSVTAPTNVTQGQLWYNPLARRFFVLGGHAGWIPIWAPLQFHSARFRFQAAYPQRQPTPLQLHNRSVEVGAGFTAYNPTVLASAVSVVYPGVRREMGQGVISEDLVPYGASAASLTPLCDWGVVLTREPFGTAMEVKDSPVKFDGFGKLRLESYATDTTLASNQYNIYFGIEGWLSPTYDSNTSDVTMTALYLFPPPGLFADTV